MAEFSQLDIDYSPSRWSKRYSHEEICGKHIEFLSKKSEEVRSKYHCELNIPYGSGEREKYDVFGLDLKGGAPVLIYIHGGYWQEPTITHSLYACLAEPFVQNGIKTIFIGYELCPKVTLEQLQKNIETAFKRCLKHAMQYHPKAIYIAGHSAGAQLAMHLYNNFISFLPTQEQRLIRDGFLLAGIYNLVPFTDTVYNEAVKLDKNIAYDCSPYHQQIARRDGRVLYVVAAEHDSPVFVKESEQFAKRLQERIKCDYILVENVDHFDLVEKLTDSSDYLLKDLMIDVMIGNP